LAFVRMYLNMPASSAYPPIIKPLHKNQKQLHFKSKCDALINEV